MVLANLAGRTEPGKLTDKKVMEVATLVIPKYAARDAVFQGTLRER